MDTYKIGVTRNSTSTMHTLQNEEICFDLFEIDDFTEIENEGGEILSMLSYLEYLRKKFNETGDRVYWKELIRWLPESFLQTAMVTMTYENLYNIIQQRKGHKLSEWHQFVDWAKELPYAEELIFHTKKIKLPDPKEIKLSPVDAADVVEKILSKDTPPTTSTTSNCKCNSCGTCKCDKEEKPVEEKKTEDVLDRFFKELAEAEKRQRPNVKTIKINNDEEYLKWIDNLFRRYF